MSGTLYGSTMTAGTVAKANEVGTETLYRAVGPDEFYDVMRTGQFATTIKSMEAKQFGTNLDETLRFTDWAQDVSAVLEERV